MRVHRRLLPPPEPPADHFHRPTKAPRTESTRSSVVTTSLASAISVVPFLGPFRPASRSVTSSKSVWVSPTRPRPATSSRLSAIPTRITTSILHTSKMSSHRRQPSPRNPARPQPGLDRQQAKILEHALLCRTRGRRTRRAMDQHTSSTAVLIFMAETTTLPRLQLTRAVWTSVLNKSDALPSPTSETRSFATSSPRSTWVARVVVSTLPVWLG